MHTDNQKNFRLLYLYDRLLRGGIIRKKETAEKFSISEKSVQRDIEDLRSYLEESYGEKQQLLYYDRQNNGYRLRESDNRCLTETEVLSLAKILLESRAFTRQELENIVHKLLGRLLPEQRAMIWELISGEMLYYPELQHKKALLEPMQTVSLAIWRSEYLAFSYRRADGTIRQHRVRPIAVIFSEFYFYLAAELPDREYTSPTIFRLDRMEQLRSTGEHFSAPDADRFQAGELRQRVQLMMTGPLKTVTFTFRGPSAEAVLDKLPTARILDAQDGVYTICAQSCGDGIDMWLQSQGNRVKILYETSKEDES